MTDISVEQCVTFLHFSVQSRETKLHEIGIGFVDDDHYVHVWIYLFTLHSLILYAMRILMNSCFVGSFVSRSSYSTSLWNMAWTKWHMQCNTFVLKVPSVCELVSTTSGSGECSYYRYGHPNDWRKCTHYWIEIINIIILFIFLYSFFRWDKLHKCLNEF